MKTIIKTLTFIIVSLVSFNNWAYTIGGGATDVGDLDYLMTSTTLPDSGDATETNWVSGYLSFYLGYEVTAAYETRTEEGALSWSLVDGMDDMVAHALVTDPEYFVIKAGGGNWSGDTHFLFENADSLSYAVVDLGFFSDAEFLEFDRISHLAEFNATTTTTNVPEPGTLALLGLGLLGLASRRFTKA